MKRISLFLAGEVLFLGMFFVSAAPAFAACREVTCLDSCDTQLEVTNACKTEINCKKKACIPKSFVSSCPNFNTQCVASCTGNENSDCTAVVCPTGTKYCIASETADPCASGGVGTCETPTSGISCPDGREYLKYSQTCADLGTPMKICCKKSGGGGEAGGLTCPTGFESYAGVCFPTAEKTGLSKTPIADILLNLMKWMLYLFGFLAIIAFVISGIQYLAAAGNMNMIETAKRNMNYSIIGIIVALAGVVILVAIDTLLKGTGWGG